MDIKSPVIVTALYDIGRDKWEKYTHSYGGYIHLMERTLSIKSKMVIYIPEKFKEEVINYRKKYDENLDDTIIVVQELEELDSYKIYNDRLNKLMFSESFMKKADFDVPEMNRPLYNIIMFNKVFWLKDCVDKKYFDNDLVIWADAGGLREPIELYRDKVWPNIDKLNNIEKNKNIFFSHNQDFNIDDKEFHALSQVRNIQGTAFFVPSHLIHNLTEEFLKTVDECMLLGYIGSDEKILDMIYIKDKSKHHLIECTWREYFKIFE